MELCYSQKSILFYDVFAFPTLCLLLRITNGSPLASNKFVLFMTYHVEHAMKICSLPSIITFAKLFIFKLYTLYSNICWYVLDENDFYHCLHIVSLRHYLDISITENFVVKYVSFVFFFTYIFTYLMLRSVRVQ